MKEDTSIEQKIDKELSKSSGTTQVATTTGSYVKVANIIKGLFSKIRKIKGEVLDYGAGLGLGTDAMSKVLGTEVDSFEVNPGRWKGKKQTILPSKKTTKLRERGVEEGEGGQKLPILRRHSLWTTPYHDAYVYDEVRSCFLCKGVINVKFMSPLLRKRSIF